jgi:hypothetical protein
MVIFIDESGTHKNTGYSTTAIVYVEVVNLEGFEKEMKRIEQDLGISSFHWAHERWLMKNKFMTAIFQLEFILKAAIFENPVHPQRMVEYIFQHLITEENIHKIYIDGKKPKWYEARLKKVLRDRGIAVKKLITVRSESEVGIQLADALAGLIRYHYDNPEEIDAKKWFKKLKRDKKLVAEFIFDTEAAKKLLPRQ